MSLQSKGSTSEKSLGVFGHCPLYFLADLTEPKWHNSCGQAPKISKCQSELELPQTILTSVSAKNQKQVNAHLNLDNASENKCPKPSCIFKVEKICVVWWKLWIIIFKLASDTRHLASDMLFILFFLLLFHKGNCMPSSCALAPNLKYQWFETFKTNGWTITVLTTIILTITVLTIQGWQLQYWQ